MTADRMGNEQRREWAGWKGESYRAAVPFCEGEPIFVRKSKVFLFQKWSKIKQS